MDQDEKIAILAGRFPSASRADIVAALKQGGNMNIRASKILRSQSSAKGVAAPVPPSTFHSELLPADPKLHVSFSDSPNPAIALGPKHPAPPIVDRPGQSPFCRNVTSPGRTTKPVRQRRKKSAEKKFQQATVKRFKECPRAMRVSRPGMATPLFKKIFNMTLSQEGETRTFSVRSYIGDGVTGQIYIATDTTDPDRTEKYALKVFTKRRSKEDPELTLLKRLNVSDLKHPNIIGIKYFSSLPLCAGKGGYGFIMLELAKNGELFEYVATEPFDEDYSRYFMRQVLSAVEHLHRRGIVHRDLKPENFLLDSKARLRICDFGHAKLLERAVSSAAVPTGPMPPMPPMPKLVKTRTKAVASPAYKAPILNDLKSGESYDAMKLDVWEIGVVLFVMVAQDYPFGQTRREISKSVIDRLLDGNHNKAFWSSWESKGVYFSQEAKEFLNKIFTTNADSRADVAELSRMAWVTKGSAPSQSDVVEEMRRRARDMGREPDFSE